MGRKHSETLSAYKAALNDVAANPGVYTTKQWRERHRIAAYVCTAATDLGLFMRDEAGRLHATKEHISTADANRVRHHSNYLCNKVRKSRKKAEEVTYAQQMELKVDARDRRTVERMAHPVPMTIKLDDPDAPKVRIKIGRLELRW